jgi:hypothetical protein
MLKFLWEIGISEKQEMEIIIEIGLVNELKK